MRERPGETLDRAEARAQGRGPDTGPPAFSSDSSPALWEPGKEVSAARWCDS